MVEDRPDNGAGKPPETISKLDSARLRLCAFLDTHPNSTIEEIDIQEGKRLGIKKPWGEEAIVIYLPDELDVLADALNNLYLPDYFSAIWHKDSKDFEVIWTAYPLGGPFEEVKTRKFLFQHQSVEHECEFGRSSDRLLLIAEHAAPVSLSRTGHRNLFSFSQYVRQQKSKSEPDTPEPPLGEPVSFWIRNVEWDDDRVLSLANHLNFYMTYYDSRSPAILVHPPKAEPAEPRTRYIIGDFPERLDGRVIEDDLLNLWAASQVGDAGRRFVYCYRIIEYASHAYVDREARVQVLKLLSAAHALADTSGLADQVIAATLSSKAEEVQRVHMLLKGAVDFDLLWREIEKNRWAFTKEEQFDGGFTLPALLSAEATKSTFKTNGLVAFANLARQIRNHLSHGRDRTTQTSITPTVANSHRLGPWASAMSVVAGEVINFKHIM